MSARRRARLVLNRYEGRGGRWNWRRAVLVEGTVHHGPPGHPGGIPRSGCCSHRGDGARVAHAGAT